MKQRDFFGNGIWLTGISDKKQPFYILRGHIGVKKVKKATLSVLGLGFFHCYINGKRVSEDEFLPLSTDYEQRENWPKEEIMTGHRIYVPQYDVTELLQDGDNVIVTLDTKWDLLKQRDNLKYTIYRHQSILQQE